MSSTPEIKKKIFKKATNQLLTLIKKLETLQTNKMISQRFFQNDMKSKNHF